MSESSGRCDTSALLSDYYQFTMADAYYRLGMEEVAVFEFFVRRLPDTRNFLVAAGLEQVLDYLESLSFGADEIDWLRRTERFSPEFLERLESFRFTGHVFAIPEGTVFFASEPVLRVEAPLPEAQIVESRIVNLLHYQTMIASKAARIRLAAPSAELIDFGMRRAHGAEAACLASRASYIAGFDGTATAEAARRFGIPVLNTMAHSFVLAHDLETHALRNFASYQARDLVLLIDTYDMSRGAARAARLARELRQQGVLVNGVRIDSGDLVIEARRVREILDENGCEDVRIFASGNLDEYAVEALQAARAPIDAYCIGTRLAVSEDAPALDCAYKLHQYAGRPRRKRSQWKESYPGPRQVYRQLDPHGRIARDVIGCSDEPIEGKPLLQEVMVFGRRTCTPPALSEVRCYCAEQLATLPVPLRVLEHVAQPPTKVSARQHALAEEVDQMPS